MKLKNRRSNNESNILFSIYIFLHDRFCDVIASAILDAIRSAVFSFKKGANDIQCGLAFTLLHCQNVPF